MNCIKFKQCNNTKQQCIANSWTKLHKIHCVLRITTMYGMQNYNVYYTKLQMN